MPSRVRWGGDVLALPRPARKRRSQEVEESEPPNPGYLAGRAARGPAGRAGADPGSMGRRRGRMRVTQAACFQAHTSHIFLLSGGAKMHRWGSLPGIRGARRLATPGLGARASRSPERVKRTTCPVLQIEAFAGRDTGKKGGEGAQRKVGAAEFGISAETVRKINRNTSHMQGRGICLGKRRWQRLGLLGQPGPAGYARCLLQPSGTGRGGGSWRSLHFRSSRAGKPETRSSPRLAAAANLTANFASELLGRLKQENCLNLGGGGCSELRFSHCTPACVTKAELHLKKEKKTMASPYVDQAGVELLASSNLPTSPPKVLELQS
ncbi:hypothetical protein AAY473_015294 [Plecturocebus cupreus]